MGFIVICIKHLEQWLAYFKCSVYTAVSILPPLIQSTWVSLSKFNGSGPFTAPWVQGCGQLYRAQDVLARKSGEKLGLFPSRPGVWNECPPFPNQSVYSSTSGFNRY